jgi:hypothetical protein
VPALTVCLPRGGWRASVNRRPPNYLDGRVLKSDEAPRKHGLGLADPRWPCMSKSRFIQRFGWPPAQAATGSVPHVDRTRFPNDQAGQPLDG